MTLVCVFYIAITQPGRKSVGQVKMSKTTILPSFANVTLCNKKWNWCQVLLTDKWFRAGFLGPILSFIHQQSTPRGVPLLPVFSAGTTPRSALLCVKGHRAESTSVSIKRLCSPPPILHFMLIMSCHSNGKMQMQTTAQMQMMLYSDVVSRIRPSCQRPENTAQWKNEAFYHFFSHQYIWKQLNASNTLISDEISMWTEHTIRVPSFQMPPPWTKRLTRWNQKHLKMWLKSSGFLFAAVFSFCGIYWSGNCKVKQIKHYTAE